MLFLSKNSFYSLTFQKMKSIFRYFNLNGYEHFNPNKAELFEGSFSWGKGRGGQLDPRFIFQEELI